MHLAVSMALMRASASQQNNNFLNSSKCLRTPSLPVPFMNILNGGAHADNSVDIQIYDVPFGLKLLILFKSRC